MLELCLCAREDVEDILLRSMLAAVQGKHCACMCESLGVSGHWDLCGDLHSEKIGFRERGVAPTPGTPDQTRELGELGVTAVRC